MKHFFGLALFFLFTPALMAQQAVTNDSARIDSLEQIVSQLSSKVSETEENLRLTELWKRRKFKSIAFVKQSLTHQDIAGMKWKSDFGASLQMGRTYYLHKKPLAKMIKFGLDWVYMDLNYAKYSEAFTDEVFGGSGNMNQGETTNNGFNDFGTDGYYSGSDMDFDLGCHQVDYSMQFGPSVTINPVSSLMVGAYFRYAPTASCVLLNDEVHLGYASFFTSGCFIAWKAISIGFEYRWGKSKYNSLSFDEESTDFDDMDDIGGGLDTFFSSEKNRMKTSSFRISLSFRM